MGQTRGTRSSKFNLDEVKHDSNVTACKGCLNLRIFGMLLAIRIVDYTVNTFQYN